MDTAIEAGSRRAPQIGDRVRINHGITQTQEEGVVTEMSLGRTQVLVNGRWMRWCDVVLIVEVEPPKPDTLTATRFWLVWKGGGGTPIHKHRTLAEAEREADRLATRTPGKFYILETVAFKERAEVPVTSGVIVDAKKGRGDPDDPFYDGG